MRSRLASSLLSRFILGMRLVLGPLWILIRAVKIILRNDRVSSLVIRSRLLIGGLSLSWGIGWLMLLLAPGRCVLRLRRVLFRRCSGLILTSVLLIFGDGRLVMVLISIWIFLVMRVGVGGQLGILSRLFRSLLFNLRGFGWIVTYCLVFV